MPTFHDAFDSVRTALNRHAGPAADQFKGMDPFHAMVAVCLDRALGGARSRAALDGLDDAGLLSPERLADVQFPEINESLGEKGIASAAKTIAPLRHLARWVVDQTGTDGSPVEVDDTGKLPAPTAWLREQLSTIKGIGPATADAVVLFALKRPSYPVDRASFRVLVRHGWLDPTATYDEARDFVVERAVDAVNDLEDQAVLALSELSHGMERIGRQFCRAAAPHCEGCPLEPFLPEGGPREVDA